MSIIVEIDWADDEAGQPLAGPVGPFGTVEEAHAWAERTICNGEWNTAILVPPRPDHTDGSQA